MSGHDDPLERYYINPGNADGGFVQPDHPAAVFYLVDGTAEKYIAAGQTWCLCYTLFALAVNPGVPSSATQSMALHSTFFPDGEPRIQHYVWKMPRHIADEIQDADVGTRWRAPEVDSLQHQPIVGPGWFKTWVANATKNDAAGEPGHAVFAGVWQMLIRTQ